MDSEADLAAGRELDALVAEKVLGYELRRVKPDWYPVEVLCFYRPGSSLMEYSCDERSCNAMMFRNGKDDSDGTASPLPFYSEELEHAWEVVEKMRGDHGAFDMGEDKRPGRGPWYCRFMGGSGYAEAETAPLAICRAALKAVGGGLS